MESKQHWENVFSTKSPNEVSWTQVYPKTSMDYLEALQLPKTANIIDVGGGDSNLVDALLENGYENIWVLDISATALEKAKKRLGDKAINVHWIVSDITEFETDVRFDFWHDRAVFHFLTNDTEADNYINTIQQYLTPQGILIMGTFSQNGPTKCSGIEIKQYSETTITERLQKFFQKIKCITEDHHTPFNTIQNFIFCSFSKLQNK